MQRESSYVLWRKRDHQLANGDNAIFFSGGKSFSSVNFKSPWSSTLRLVPLIDSSDGDRDGDFDTLSNVGGGVDRSPERVIIDCTSGVPDRLPFNFSVRSFAAKLLVNERAWAWQVAWNIYSAIKIWTQKRRQLKTYPIILLDSILPNPVFVVL